MNRSPATSSLHKILIIRMSSVGDIVLTTPLLRALRQQFPAAELHFVVRREYQELVKYNPHLNQIFVYDVATGFSGLKELKKQLQKQLYDVVLDLHGNFRSWYLRRLGGKPRILKINKNRFLRFLLVKFKINLYSKFYSHPLSVAEKYLKAAAPLGIQTNDLKLEFSLPEAVENQVRERFEILKDEGLKVVIAPGARHFTKRWLPEYYVQLISRIYSELGWRSVLVGAPEEVPLSQEIAGALPSKATVNLTGELTLLEAAAVIRMFPYFISNDSGLMHIAAAFQKPQIAIFGSTTRELGFYPINPHARVVENTGLSCRPCSHIGRSRCPRGHFKCMRELTPEVVFQEVKTTLLSV